jgi:dUTP pyrophosphatase
MTPQYLKPSINISIDKPICLPIRAHDSDAGADLRARDNTVLRRNVRTLVDTGVRAQIPIGHVGLLISRSSLSKHGIIMTNSVGVIDSAYRGNIMASLMYTGDLDDFYLNEGDRIVQLLVVPIILPEFVVLDKLEDTVRGTGGFGSTGAT